MKTIVAKAFLLIFAAAAVLFVAAYAYTVFRDTVNADISVAVPEAVTVAELYDVMQRDGAFALPYDLRGEGDMMHIVFPLAGNSIIKITAEDRVIRVCTTKENWWMDIGLRQWTHQWTNIFDAYQRDHQPTLERIADEIRRITGGA